MTPEQKRRLERIMVEIGEVMSPVGHAIGEAQIIFASGLLGLLRTLKRIIDGRSE
jgi:hypothetical protein